MKTRADLYINGEYRRISIWQALYWKRNQPDLWEKYKNNLYSINKNPEDKVQMFFQIGRNGDDRRSYFRYASVAYEREGEGSEESYRHEFFKECFSRIKKFNLQWKGETVTIYVDEALQEETIYLKDGSKRIVDILIKFHKTEPMIYVEKWEGKLAIEIFETHKIDDKKIKQMKNNNIAMFEFPTKKWNIKEFFNSEEEEEQEYNRIYKIFAGEEGGFIRGELLSDPISNNYFKTELYLQEKKEKERIQKELVDLNQKLKEYYNVEKVLRQRICELEMECQSMRENCDRELKQLKRENANLIDENSAIKKSFAYKIFIRK